METAAIHTTGSAPEDNDDNKAELRARLRRQVRLGLFLDHTADWHGMHEQMQHMEALEKVDIYVERSFDITSSTTIEQFGRLVKAMGALPKLQWLHIRSGFLRIGGQQQCTELPLFAFETLLQSSQSLKYLHLCYINFVKLEDNNKDNSSNNKCPLMAIAQLMKNNTTVKELRLAYAGLPKVARAKGQQALLRMLSLRNFTLECLDFDDRTLCQISKARQNEMAFWLLLNNSQLQKGMRERLFFQPKNQANPPTLHEWQDAVIRGRNRTSIVYHLLSNNPTMIIAAAAGY